MKYNGTTHQRVRELSDNRIIEVYPSCSSIPMNILYDGGSKRKFSKIIGTLVSLGIDRSSAKVLVHHTGLAMKQGCKGFVVPLMKGVFTRLRKEHPDRDLPTYERFSGSIQTLVNLGYATLYIGDKQKANTEFKYKSILVLGAKMKDLFTLDALSTVKIPVPKMCELVSVKDAISDALSGIHAIRKEIQIVNTHLKAFDIRCEGNPIYITLRRLYEKDLKHYGRWYFSAQGLKAEFRKFITIDGEPTIELDYSSNHARICAELAGVKLPKDFKPYAVAANGLVTHVPEGREEREVYKLGIMCILNCKGKYAEALKSSWDKELKGFGGKENCTEIINGLLDHNKAYLHELKKQNASTLQYIDSEILRYILLGLVEDNQGFLPYHDSVRVAESNLDILKTLMYAGWKHVLGTNHNCIVDIK